MRLFQFELSIYLCYSLFLVLKEIKNKGKTIDEIISYFYLNNLNFLIMYSKMI